MKFIKRILFIISLITLMIPLTIKVYSIPHMPHQFYGDVTVGVEPATDGTLIEAKIEGIIYESTTTLDGKYGWDPFFKVPGDDPNTFDIEGGINGDIIEFYIDGVLANTYVFEIGAIAELDLDLFTKIYEIQLFEGWNLIGLPCTPEDSNIEFVLADILNNLESVWTFNGEIKTWSVYSPGTPSDLTEMVDDKGYWINMNKDVKLFIRAISCADITASLTSTYHDVWGGTDYHVVEGLLINFGSDPAYSVAITITWHTIGGGYHTEPANWIGTLGGHEIYEYSHTYYFEGSYDDITWIIEWS